MRKHTKFNTKFQDKMDTQREEGNFIDACKQNEVDFLNNFKYNLKLLRTSIGYTSEELTIKLGMGGKRINDLEEGRCPPKIEDLIKIEMFFSQVSSIDQLFKCKVELQFKS